MVMSIRNRVMLATLGLAAVAFVVTLEAIDDDKVLIVRDGSVEIYTNNSSFHQRDNDRKQKWSKKANTVQIFEDATAAEACTTPLNNHQPVPFRQVELKVMDLDNNQPVNIVAANEGAILGKLKLRLPDEWRFVFRQYKHRLVYGSQTASQERKVKLQQVVITADNDAGTQTTLPSSPSTTGYLCVRFLDH
jgi:hypothetical protein